ncbi:MAG: 3-oxoacyl-ACP reductase FabG [Flavobacteriales bacterium]|nr:MAG: 3-oxoacyl-ACP reductase FabG [Flavobacteriales bacterium]
MKYALVTGGSRGIGRAICVKLAEMGYNVLINYQSNENAANETLALVKEKGIDGETMKFDVSKQDEVEKALNNWYENHTEDIIEVLVNNAGIARDGLFAIMKNEDWHDVLNTSLHGFFYTTRFLAQKMLRKRYGRIINIVSLSGLKGQAGQVNYSAAKAAVIGATKALGQEIAKRNITVNAVAPGFIKTDMTAELPEDELKKLVPMQRFGEVEEVSEIVGFLASEKASYITGEVISVNGGIYT